MSAKRKLNRAYLKKLTVKERATLRNTPVTSEAYKAVIAKINSLRSKV